MTSSSPNPPATPPPQRGRGRWRKLFFMLALLAVAGVAGGAWWAWIFIHEKLAPLVSQSLTKELNRPVMIGDLQQVSFSSLRFGRSQIPATADDPDQATVEAVQVQFNPWQLIWRRQLALNVTLVKPEVYLEQNMAGLWVSTKLRQSDEKGPIKIQLNQFRMQDGTVELSPRPKPKQTRRSVRLQKVAGFVNLLDRARRFSYYVRADSAAQGNFRLRGESKLVDKKQLLTKINVEGDDFLLTEIDRLIRLPVDIQSGRADARVDVTLNPDLSFKLLGRAQLRQVNLTAAGTPRPLNNINGEIDLVDQTVKLNDVKGKFGQIPVAVTGLIDPQKGFALSGEIATVGIPDFLKTFNIKTPVPVIGAIGAKVRMSGPIDGPIIAGTVRNTQTVVVDKLAFDRAAGQFRLNTETGRLDLSNLVATPTIGGRITGSGTLGVMAPQSANLNLQVAAVPGDQVAQIYTQQDAPFKIGPVNAAVQVRGPVTNLVTTADWQAPRSDYAARGQVVMAQNGQQIQLRQLNAQAFGGTLTATGQLQGKLWNTDVRVVNANLAQVNPQLQGVVSGAANLSGRIDQPSLAGVNGRINLTAQTYGGRINAVTRLANQRWQTQANLYGIQLAQANPELRGAADGNVQLSGRLDNLTIPGIRAAGKVRLSEGVAVVRAPIDTQFAWDGRQINLISATGPGLRASGRIFANVQGSPSITGLDLNVDARNFALADLPLSLPDQLQVSGLTDFQGKITGALNRPRIKGAIGLQNFSVNQLGFERLQGRVDLSPQRGIQLQVAGGQDRLAFALNAQNQPQLIQVKRGDLKIEGKARGSLFDLSLAAIPLAELSTLGLPLPDVMGELFGTATLDLARNELPQANITVQNLDVGEFPAVFRSQSMNARLSYVNGIARGMLTLQQPRFGTIQSNDVTTNFVYANNILRVSDLTLQKGDSRFTIVGAIDLNQPTPQVTGRLNVAQGRIEDVLGALQIFRIEDFLRGPTLPTYAAANDIGRPTVGAPLHSDVSLKTQLERLAELNTQIAQIARQRKELFRPVPGSETTEILRPEYADIRGRFDSNLRFQFGPGGLAVDEFQLQARNVEWRPYPGYARLQRLADRQIVVQEENRILQIQSLFVDATYNAGQLNLTRALAQIGNAAVSLQLNYGGAVTSGQIAVERLPIREIQRFYPFPGSNTLQGELNATATIGGDRANPIAQGVIRIAEGSLNGTPILRAGGTFGYNRGRLNLASAIRLVEDKPLRIEGEIPLPLPFIGVEPASNAITADVKVEDEGIGLINLFDSPVKWLGGQGKVELKVRGEGLGAFFNARGSIALEKAKFEVDGLPEPLTNVTGKINFVGDNVKVEQLEGQFSQGNVAARGTIPLFGQVPNLAIPVGIAVDDCLGQSADQPLNLVLNQISLSYKGLYEGGVRGCLNVAGNLFRPQVTGEITLFDGQVLLADTAPAGKDANATEASVEGGAARRASVDTPVGASPDAGLVFNGLRLQLDRGIQVVKAPIVNFVAAGTLTVNGSLNALKPQGEIFLRSGQVNIFTTQFVLVRGYPSRAIFQADQGLDPDLDVRLIASVPEVTRNPLLTQTQQFSSEIADSPLFATGFGTLQTVRIEAKVSGPSSLLFDNLELSSSPSRSRNEIIGLLGGGFIDTLGRGDSTLGIANLAGSALLTNIQGFIGNALGLSEFRLFPTISTDADRRSSTLGLAAEAGVDITPALSGSVLKILTSEQPAQFGLRYRINDNFLFRGSTDFFGDSRAVLEYNARF